MRYEIEFVSGQIIDVALELSGPMSKEGAEECLAALLSDPDWRPDMKVLVDGTRLTAGDLGASGVRAVAQTVVSNDDDWGPGVTALAVAEDDHAEPSFSGSAAPRSRRRAHESPRRLSCHTRLRSGRMRNAGDGGSAVVASSIVDEAMRELMQRTGDGALTVGAALAATATLRDAADHKLFELVGFAREAGASWSAIGEALGVTTQGAHQRYGPKPSARTADGAS